MILLTYFVYTFLCEANSILSPTTQCQKGVYDLERSRVTERIGTFAQFLRVTNDIAACFRVTEGIGAISP